MIEYLAFQVCKEDSSSRYIKFFKKGDKFFLETAEGVRGMYIISKNDSEKIYRCDESSARIISSLIEPLKLYGWPKTVPSDFVPTNAIMGCDEYSWSLDYKEVEKKTMRHIRGKGSFPKESPYKEFYRLFIRTIPDQEMKEWFLEEYEEGI